MCVLLMRACAFRCPCVYFSFSAAGFFFFSSCERTDAAGLTWLCPSATFTVNPEKSLRPRRVFQKVPAPVPAFAPGVSERIADLTPPTTWSENNFINIIG